MLLPSVEPLAAEGLAIVVVVGGSMAAYIVRGDEYSVLGLVAPLVGRLFLAVSPPVWNAGIKKYESTGS